MGTNIISLFKETSPKKGFFGNKIILKLNRDGYQGSRDKQRPSLSWFDISVHLVPGRST